MRYILFGCRGLRYNGAMSLLANVQIFEWLFVIVGYLAGSVSAAILVCRLMGLSDPRLQGSKNPGATNVMRLHGKQAAIITLLGDVLKGVVPILAARWAGASYEVQILVGIAAFLGHLYPVYFGFKGGKGVATAYGVLFTLDWRLGMACGATWIAVFALKRISSLAALTAFLVLPLYSWAMHRSLLMTLACVLISALIYWRHRSNIRLLLAGEEK